MTARAIATIPSERGRNPNRRGDPRTRRWREDSFSCMVVRPSGTQEHALRREHRAAADAKARAENLPVVSRNVAVKSPSVTERARDRTQNRASAALHSGSIRLRSRSCADSVRDAESNHAAKTALVAGVPPALSNRSGLGPSREPQHRLDGRVRVLHRSEVADAGHDLEPAGRQPLDDHLARAEAGWRRCARRTRRPSGSARREAAGTRRWRCPSRTSPPRPPAGTSARPDRRGDHAGRNPRRRAMRRGRARRAVASIRTTQMLLRATTTPPDDVERPLRAGSRPGVGAGRRSGTRSARSTTAGRTCRAHALRRGGATRRPSNGRTRAGSCSPARPSSCTTAITSSANSDHWYP